MIEEALVQGAVSGGIAGITIISFTKYILPRFDKLDMQQTEVLKAVQKCKR